MKGTFFKGVVLGALTSTLVLIAATALAGTGINAVFNLGKTNKVNAQSTLKGATNGKTLQLTNSGTGSALGINVAAGKAPMVVNSGVRVRNLNADKLDGKDSATFIHRCGLGSVAAAARWYAPALTTDPTYVEPNRYGGEGGSSCNGGTIEMTKEGTGWYRMKIDPALTGHEYIAFANADAWGSTPLYAQGAGPFAGPIWDVFVHDKDGNLADAYYIEVAVIVLP